ncbi:MAG: phosphate ABC transporter permease subunit PstC [Candidatus Marinimicrobia bacterium CG08_land_8_20_14_0_20_45_22]|nr:MAG: phosphate ABC transporter permease subunit PstC [Candidatus Marinimicrobia bacterium CG08_land_8_20_14_0_20_45_22]
MRSKISEKAFKYGFMGMAFSSLLFLLGIIIILFSEGLPVFNTVNLMRFIGGTSWYPTSEPPEFGILPLILGTLWVTLGAMLICIPIGLGSALYLHEIAGRRQKAVLKPLIELLASIPSIVYGFFGMIIVAPYLQRTFDLSTGLCAFTASLILGIMAVPTVCSLAEDALNYVPKSFREAAYAVGANRWQTLTQIILPAAGSGISTAIILGMSRVVGETMTVLMVAGGAAMIPQSVFDPVRPMTSTIAAEMGEAAMGSPHYHALFAIGLILFLITFVFNIIAEIISRRYRLKLGLGR